MVDNTKTRRNWRFLGPFTAIVLALNFWYDYYHPPGIVFDLVLLIVLGAKLLSDKKSK